MNELESNESGYPETVLLGFVFGALLTLIYYQRVIVCIKGIEEFAVESMIFLLLIDVFLSSSVAASVFVPVNSVCFGMVTAVRIRGLLYGSAANGMDKRMALLFLLISVPMHFALGVYGMKNSFCIRESLHSRGQYGTAKLVIMYTIMLAGIISAMLFFRYIMII